MRSSTFSQCSLFVAAAVILGLAAVVWTKRQPVYSFGAQGSLAAAQPGGQQQDVQKAASLLFRAFHADNYLTYSAISRTMAMYGGGKRNSEAEIVHAPQKFAITYKSGDLKGVHTGYNQYWFWRQDHETSPMQPYAQVRLDTTDMATRRFALMLVNYAAVYTGTEQIDGRPVDIVELRPFKPAEGAKGPAKRLSIDQETGLTVRVQTFNYDLHPVMESTLAEVDYTPEITNATFRSREQIISAKKNKEWIAQEEDKDEATVTRRTGLKPPKPAYLPAGFDFDGVGMHKCEYAGAPYCASLARYTDGLNTLTVFHLKEAAAPAKGAVKPAVPANTKAPAKLDSCAYGPGTMVTREVTDGRLLAVADLPAPVLQKVLDSVPAAIACAGK